MVDLEKPIDELRFAHRDLLGAIDDFDNGETTDEQARNSLLVIASHLERIEAQLRQLDIDQKIIMQGGVPIAVRNEKKDRRPKYSPNSYRPRFT